MRSFAIEFFIQSSSPSSYFGSFSSLAWFYNVCRILGLVFESIALKLNGQILVPLNLDMIFCLVNAKSSVLSTHLANVILLSSM